MSDETQNTNAEESKNKPPKPRKYIGPAYKNALIVNGVKPKLDPRAWDAETQERMIRTWPQLESLFK